MQVVVFVEFSYLFLEINKKSPIFLVANKFLIYNRLYGVLPGANRVREKLLAIFYP
jgi:hypothetical protein